MDAQMKRGFLEACVLATLDRRESYGYQIVKEVPIALGLTESTLYPLLKRLEAAGCIDVRTAEHNGRLRKYYRTTEEGKRRIAEFVAERSEVLAIYDFVEAATGKGAMARSVAPTQDSPLPSVVPKEDSNYASGQHAKSLVSTNATTKDASTRAVSSQENSQDDANTLNTTNR